MNVFGTMLNNMLTIATTAVGEYKMEDYVSTEKRLIIVPEADAVMHLLLTAGGSTTNADVEDLLIPAEGIDIVVGRSLDRVSIYNETGSTKKAYISVLY